MDGGRVNDFSLIICSCNTACFVEYPGSSGKVDKVNQERSKGIIPGLEIVQAGIFDYITVGNTVNGKG